MVNDKMTDERDDRIYRKLEFFKSINQEVHIRIIAGMDAGCFRNGFILDISLKQKCFVFIDNVMGERPYLFEEVDENIVKRAFNNGGKRE